MMLSDLYLPPLFLDLKECLSVSVENRYTLECKQLGSVEVFFTSNTRGFDSLKIRLLYTCLFCKIFWVLTF